MRKFILLSLFSMSIIQCSNEPLPELSNGVVIRLLNFKSNFVTTRNVDVWLPEDYNEKEKYNVLYMHDGQMLYDKNITWNNQEWEVDETISKLIKEGEIERCIVVGIWNVNEFRRMDYFPQKPYNTLPDSIKTKIFDNGEAIKANSGADNYLKFIVEELKPYIDKNFSTNNDVNSTFIAGSSMGGLISMYAICEYPQIFSGAACISTHWPGYYNFDDNTVPQAFQEYLNKNLPDKSTHKIYFDFGTETLDQYYEYHQIKIDSVMHENGWNNSNWITLKFDGENHSEKSWSKRLAIPIKFIMNKSK
jgi:enterochelin esterase-like enzyme